MEEFDIHAADEAEREIAAGLLAGSEPWITLGITREQCDRTCHDTEYQLYFATIHGNVGGLISPVLTPAIAAVIGWENALHVAARIAVVGAALWLGIKP